MPKKSPHVDRKRTASPRTRASSRTKARARLHPKHAIGGLALAAGAALVAIFAVLPTLQGRAANCSISDKLVNSCRPWLGATANNYPQVALNTKSQILYHEQRIGRQLDLVHTYHPVGKNQLDATDIYFATRSNTYLFTNWKPAAKWSDAAGGNAATNADIDQMANSIKSIAPKKVLLTVHHEPENDVSGGAPGCSTFKGSAGTPTDYKNMWHNVRSRFDALGVSNVVWAIDYMNYSQWDCMINDLYPGDNYVDWVVFNAYAGSSHDYNSNVSHFYNLLTNNSNGQHNYTSKTWGIVEWGAQGNTAQRQDYLGAVKTALDNNTFPRLKMYMAYDSRDKGSATGASSRIAYDDSDVYQQAQVDKYNAFANDPNITDSVSPPPPPTDNVPPSAALTAPSNNATVSGNVGVTGTASDNVGVQSVAMYVDGKSIASDSSSPYGFTLNTTDLTNGTHQIKLRATDTNNNQADSNTITITVSNSTATPDPGTGSGGGQTGANNPPPASTITAETPSSPANPIAVGGTVVVNPTTPGSSVEVYVDGKKQGANSINTKTLSNGVHRITIVENGKSSTSYIRVNNALLLAAVNNVRAHGAAYTLAGLSVIAVIVWTIFFRTRLPVFNKLSFRKQV